MKEQYHLCIKNINSFIRTVQMVVRLERKRDGETEDDNDLLHEGTDIFRANQELLGITSYF